MSLQSFVKALFHHRPASGGGAINGPASTAGEPMVLSSGLGVVSREQADKVGVDELAAINGAPSDIVIVEPDGTLTGDEEAVRRALAYGMRLHDSD